MPKNPLISSSTFITYFVAVDGTARMTVYLVKASTRTSTCSFRLFNLGNGPIWSMRTVLNGIGSISLKWYSPSLRRLGCLLKAQATLDLIYDLTNPFSTVRSTLKWPALSCASWVILHRSSFGTTHNFCSWTRFYRGPCSITNSFLICLSFFF